MTTTTRPRNTLDLAVLVPYQLGYHPGPSLVLTALHERRLGMVQRHDLPIDPQDCRAVAEQALSIMAREGATQVLLIAFEEDEGSSHPLRAAITAAAPEHDLDVFEHLVVRDGRAFSPECPDPTCCPPEGRALPRPEDVPAVAAFVEAGVSPLPSREDLEQGVLPPRDESRAATLAVAAELALPQWLADEWGSDAEVALAWLRLLDPGPSSVPVTDLRDEDLLVLGISLQEHDWRDALLAVLAPGTMPLEDFDEALVGLARTATAWCRWVGEAEPEVGDHQEAILRVRERLVELARLLPEEFVPTVLTCVAHLAWWEGDGTVAGICLERALQIDPGHRLAGLMMTLLGAGVRPWATAEAA